MKNALKRVTLIEWLIVIAIIGILGSAIAGKAYGMGSKPPPIKNEQAVKAQEAADSLTFTANAEIDNIKARLELTSDPGLLGFALLLNEMGQPVAYYGIKGKITSSGKRLTKKQKLIGCDKGEWSGDCIVDAPSDEGTHGSSSPYVFFWTTEGQYIQWNGKYLYSDKPFRLSIEPIVISASVEAES